MKHIMICFVIVCVIGLSGCGEAIRQAQSAVDQAQIVLMQVESHEARILAALDAAEKVAATVGGEDAVRLVHDLKRVLIEVQSNIPAAQQGLETAKSLLASAEAAQGMSWLEIGGNVALSLLLGGGGIWQAIKARKWAVVAKHVAQVGQGFKHTAEAGKVDVSGVISKAKRDQRALGIEQEVHKVLYQ
jgi:hypothetical protein